MKPLPTRAASIDAIPEALREHYVERGGMFYLHAEPDPRIAQLETERDRYRDVVHRTALDSATDAAMAALNPRPEWSAMVRREVRARLKVDDDGATVRAYLADANGKQLEHADGRDMQPGDLRHDQTFAADFGKCLQDAADGKAKAPAGNGRDVVIPRDADQNTFEQAVATAHARGGEVLYGDSTARASGSTGPRDVSLPAGGSQQDFEKAFEQATKQGGEVVIR